MDSNQLRAIYECELAMATLQSSGKISSPVRGMVIGCPERTVMSERETLMCPVCVYNDQYSRFACVWIVIASINSDLINYVSDLMMREYMYRGNGIRASQEGR